MGNNRRWTFVLRIFRNICFQGQYLFLTFSLFWVLLGIVLNTVFGLASFYLPD
ncbi:hypothetical protein LEP1GSC056_2572 [Leptospira borgpetersenii str. Brem 328]|uniref:Uncharacterized protein n=1 Tax=Leptospira borgpetersenii str. Brem 328 TaxID=1049780 RepID=A0ABC9SGN2_LEPBO|nr:hypothetical protein LEP1GSC056_2572 [Leptospira borgpetersenii str. Brem 328]